MSSRLLSFTALLCCACAGDSTAPSSRVASIDVTISSGTATVGSVITASASVRDASGNILGDRPVAWSVSSPTVASIAATGATAQISAAAPGSVFIRASSGGVADSAALVVQPIPVATVTISPDSGSAFLGQSITFSARIQAAGGADLAGRTIAWASSNPTLATVSAAGVATALQSGTVTITATVEGRVDSAKFVARINPVLSTSYRNFKENGVLPGSIPLPASSSWGFTDVVAHGYGDFYGRGNTSDLFTARIAYAVSDGQVAAPRGVYTFWRRTGDTYAADNSILLPPSTTCLHPRKALVADFNQDARPDVFLICHGYDASPFPGERNQVLLSQSNGNYSVSDASNDVGFFHGGSAADLNGDGYPDVIVIDNFRPSGHLVLLNNGNGLFSAEATGRVPALNSGPYFTAELIDVDEDGDVDLLVAGHEWQNASTRVLLNPGNNQFGTATSVTIPAIANEGVVVDFAVTGTGSTRALWISRTSGGDGTFYQSLTIQRVRWSDKNSSVPFTERPRGWVPWLLPYSRAGVAYIGSDDLRIPLELSVP